NVAQSESFEMLQPVGQQLSFDTHCEIGEPPLQLPLKQVSPPVQGLRSSHGSPFMRFCAKHWPFVGSPVPRMQPMVSCEQFLGAPPWQTPFMHVLLTVQRSFGSMQAPPSLPGCGSHI